MNGLIPHLIDIELVAGCSDVAFSKPIGLHNPMESTHHHIMPDVKFSVLVEQRPLYIFLDNVSLLDAIEMFFFLFQDMIKLVELIDDGDALPSI
jgi:hypothetical protein